MPNEEPQWPGTPIKEMQREKAPPYNWPGTPATNDEMKSRPSSLVDASKPGSTRGRQTPASPRLKSNVEPTTMRAEKPGEAQQFAGARQRIQALKHQYLRRGDGSIVRATADALIENPRDPKALARLNLFHAETQQAVLEVVDAERQHKMENIPNYGQLRPEGGVEAARGKARDILTDPTTYALLGGLPSLLKGPVGRLLLGGLAAKTGVETVGQVREDIKRGDKSAALVHGATGGLETGLAALGAAKGFPIEEGPTFRKGAAGLDREALREGVRQRSENFNAAREAVSREKAALPRIGERGRTPSEYTIGGKNAAQEGQVPKGSVGEHPGVPQGGNVPKDQGQVRQSESGQAGDSSGPGAASAQPAENALQKVTAQIKQAQAKTKEDVKMRHAERAARFSKAGAALQQTGDFGAAMKHLEGKYGQPDFEPVKVTPEERKALESKILAYNKKALRAVEDVPNEGIKKGQLLSLTGVKIRAKTALDKVLDPVHPTIPGAQEINILREVYGEEFADALLEKQGVRPRTPLDYLVAYQRFSILSGLSTIGKLASAASGRLAITPLEELAGTVLPEGLKKLAPRQGYANPQAEVKAAMAFFHKVAEDDPGTLRDMWSKLTTGNNSIDRKYGTTYRNYEGETLTDKQVRSLFELPARAHGALKTPAQRAEFFRSLEKRTAAAVREGVDPTDPETQAGLTAGAYADSERAILMQNNFVVDGWTDMLRGWENNGTLRGKVAATIGKLTMPIVRVPTNYVAEASEYALGIPMAIAKVLKEKGLSNLSTDEAEFVARAIKKNGIGMGLFALGYLQPENLKVKGEGYFVAGEKQKLGKHPGSAEFFGYEVPHWALHNPAFELFQMGATTRKAMDAKKGLAEGAYRSASGLGQSVPFLSEGRQLGHASEGSKAAQAEAGRALRAFEPLIMQQIAQMRDKRQGKPAPRNLGEELKIGVPGLREQVPTKTKGQAAESSRRRTKVDSGFSDSSATGF